MWRKKGSCMKSPRRRKVYLRSQIPLQVLNLREYSMYILNNFQQIIKTPKKKKLNINPGCNHYIFDIKPNPQNNLDHHAYHNEIQLNLDKHA